MAKGFDANDFMKRLSSRSAPSQITGADVDNKLNEILFNLNIVKNGVTIKTGEHEALTRLFTGQKMYVDTRDISLAPHLMLDGVWEESFTRILRRYLKNDSVFFDVGANLGYFGLIAGADVLEGSIHFFEPNPLLADYISKSVAINGLHNRASVTQKAVGASADRLVLSIPGDYFGSATVRNFDKNISNYVKSENIHTIKVDQISLDSYVKSAGLKKVDVIKVDVEGFEESVVQGMENVIKNNPDLIVFLEFSAEAYKSPLSFFKNLKNAFRHSYLCDEDLVEVQTLDNIEPTIKTDGFAMLALSNNELL